MDELLKLLLLFGVGSLAGFINVMAGGGSTITLPTLIFLGLDGALANGTNRVGIFVQTLSAVISFRQEKYHKIKLSLKLAAFTLPGAIIGAIIAVNISNELFQKILGYVLIGIIFSMLLRKINKNKTEEDKQNQNSWLIYPVMFVMGFYGGFIQVGIGFMFMASLYHLLKLKLLHVNMHKVLIICIYTLPALLIFIITGNVNWKFGLVLAAGMASGAWWSAKLSIKKGEKIIQIILIAAILLMSLKLLDVI
ncbi:MAG: sulfite exporter TauE/SafE family protein [Candidatus Aminicenantes bacterium]|nr:sulfite exporter TauE/SafE family protein [Candidatus Aminicenantes bacterium]